MAGLSGLHRTAVGELVGDYLTTFARLLDPSLPDAALAGKDRDDRRPAGQVVAVATIIFLGIAGLSAAIIRYIA
jgi:hypothetical protein